MATASPELAAVLANARTKPVSAMVRVRNEEEFLATAVRSIASLVDEVVIIDNGSSDATPEVIRELAGEDAKVRACSFPHQVARPGAENLEAVRLGDASPSVPLSAYYNWSLRQCRHPFILKWDGDMIAGPELHETWETWRSGAYLSMRFAGVNAHPDRVHLLSARSRDPKVVGRPLAGGIAPGWALQMTYCDTEPWLFPRFLARYGDRPCWWCENLYSPFLFVGGRPGRPTKAYCLEPANPLYVHVKYWKQSPHANHSPDLTEMVEANMAVGPPLPDSWRQTLIEQRLLDS